MQILANVDIGRLDSLVNGVVYSLIIIVFTIILITHVNAGLLI